MFFCPKISFSIHNTEFRAFEFFFQKKVVWKRKRREVKKSNSFTAICTCKSGQILKLLIESSIDDFHKTQFIFSFMLPVIVIRFYTRLDKGCRLLGVVDRIEL